MDDAAGRIYRYGDEFEQSTALVRSDHQEALLALVLVLDETDRKIPGVHDVGVEMPCLCALSRMSIRQD